MNHSFPSLFLSLMVCIIINSKENENPVQIEIHDIDCSISVFHIYIFPTSRSEWRQNPLLDPSSRQFDFFPFPSSNDLVASQSMYHTVYFICPISSLWEALVLTYKFSSAGGGGEIYRPDSSSSKWCHRFYLCVCLWLDSLEEFPLTPFGKRSSLPSLNNADLTKYPRFLD